MDKTDKKLLNLLQAGLPLEPSPYQGIAGQLQISQAEVLSRTKNLLAAGYIRRLGGAFDTNAMGFNSMLFGIHVPEAIFYDVADFINAYANVTHNYRRSAYLNMWFTFSSKTEAERAAFTQALKAELHLDDILQFPNLKNYKLHVFFDMEAGDSR